MSKAVESPVWPCSSRRWKRAFVSSGEPKPANMRMVQRRERYICGWIPRVYGYSPGASISRPGPVTTGGSSRPEMVVPGAAAGTAWPVVLGVSRLAGPPATATAISLPLRPGRGLLFGIPTIESTGSARGSGPASEAGPRGGGGAAVGAALSRGRGVPRADLAGALLRGGRARGRPHAAAPGPHAVALRDPAAALVLPRGAAADDAHPRPAPGARIERDLPRGPARGGRVGASRRRSRRPARDPRLADG